MNTIIALSLLIVGITAFPQKTPPIIDALRQSDEKLVTGAIVSAIEDVSQSIKDAGLDPLHIENSDLNYALPVPAIFNSQAVIEELLFTGLSNIQVHNINFSVLASRLTFDIRLPLIELTIGEAEASANLFDGSTDLSVTGRFAIVGVRLNSNVRINIGIISGISIRSINLNFSILDIQSELGIQSHGRDFSASINNFLGTTVPRTLRDYSAEINELLEILVYDIANNLL